MFDKLIAEARKYLADKQPEITSDFIGNNKEG